MTDQFINDYYFWVSIPLHVLLFMWVYISNRHSKKYTENQAVMLVVAWTWPVSLIILIVALLIIVVFGVLSLLGTVATRVADKTVGRWLKTLEKGE